MRAHRAAWGIAAATLIAWGLSGAQAQDWAPARPVRMIIPVAPGSAPDLLSRIMGQGFQAKWSQPIIVEPHPGASQNIAGDLL